MLEIVRTLLRRAAFVGSPRLLHCLFLACLYLSASGQSTNRYNIDNECHDFYVRGETYAGKVMAVSLQTADSMKTRAREVKDWKAYVMAHIIPMRYYSRIKDLDKMHEAMLTLANMSKKYGYMQYYYYAYNTYIVALLNNRRMSEALEVAEKMNNESKKADDDYGLYASYRSMGNICSFRRDKSKAREYYEMALDIMDTRLPNYDQGQVYNDIAQMYSIDRDWQNLHNIARVGWQKTINPLYKRQLVAYQAQALYQLGRYKEFQEIYDTMKMTKKEVLIRPYAHLKLYNALRRKAYHYAEQHAMEQTDPVLKWRFMTLIKIDEGDFKEAYKYARITNDISNRSFDTDQMRRMASLGAGMEDEQIKSEHMRLEQLALAEKLRHEQLAAQNATLQGEIADKERRKSDAENSRMRLQGKIEKEYIKQQQVDLQMMTEYNRVRNIATALLFGMLLVIAVVLIIYIVVTRKHNKIKHESQEELQKALDKAEEENRMKTMFLYEISKNITAPMLKVVENAALAIKPGLKLSPEEKVRLSEEIRDSSSKMTTIVAHVLEQARKETENTLMADEATDQLFIENNTSVKSTETEQYNNNFT